jgi:hypothetical protein
MKCSIVSSISLHSKQVTSVSVLYIRILLGNDHLTWRGRGGYGFFSKKMILIVNGS